MVALAPSSVFGSAAETKRRAERAAPAASSDTSSGAISPLPWAAASIDALKRGAVALGDQVEDRQPSLGGVGLERVWREPRKGGVGTQHARPRRRPRRSPPASN